MKLLNTNIFILAILHLIILPKTLNAQVKDIEGRLYKTFKIGTHEIMAENLATATFSNGDKIPEAKTNEEWRAADKNQTPAWCYYNNDPATGKIHGKLYNIYAYKDSRKILPAGWKAMADDAWVDFVDVLGASNFWLKLKSVSGWKDTDGSGHVGTNESGFNLLPGGYRTDDGAFKSLGIYTYLWKENLKNNLNYVTGVGYLMTGHSFNIQKIPENFAMGVYIRGQKDMSVQAALTDDFFTNVDLDDFMAPIFNQNLLCQEVNKIITILGREDKSALLPVQSPGYFSSPKITITNFGYPNTLSEKATYTSYTAYIWNSANVKKWNTEALATVSKQLELCLHKKPMQDDEGTFIYLMNNGKIDLGLHPTTQDLYIKITVTK